MSDLQETLPDFDIKPYSHLIHSLKKNDVTVIDLVTLDPVEVARKCPLPLLDVRRLVSGVIAALQKDLKMLPTKQSTSSDLLGPTNDDKTSSTNGKTGLQGQETIFVKTLDGAIDQLLGGGVAVGHVTEVVGESAVGKTQLLMGLLLSVQMFPPIGLGKSAIYLSTEDELSTLRLQHILESNPAYEGLACDELPSFDHVRSMTVKSLELQQQIIEFQLPIAIQKYNVGLVALDSVAANFRVEHETTTIDGLADRAADLVRLGSLLRRIAIEHQVAVVVANQVSDRFASTAPNLPMEKLRTSSPAVSSTPASQSAESSSSSLIAERKEKMTLDHQQRFFTGWGDKPGAGEEGLKNPALGLTWSNQISARVVLKVEAEDSKKSKQSTGMKRKRIMNLVFAPWAPPSVRSVEYSIEEQGLVSLGTTRHVGEDEALLDESLWDDDEFP